MRRFLEIAPKRIRGRLAVLAMFVLALGVGSYAAFGYVTTPGSGTGVATIGQFSNPLDHFLVAPASGTQTSGTPFSVTVTAEDHNGNLISGYTGTVTFSSSDPHAVFPGAGSYTFTAADHGTHTFASGVTLETAGAAETVQVADSGKTGQASFVVNPGAAAQIALSAPAGDLPSAATRTFTATIEDAAGNLITTGPDSGLTVSFAAGGSGTLTGTGTATASAGVATKTVTAVLAGPATLQATATLSGPGATNSNTLAFNIVAGTATQIILSGDTSTLTAGTARTFTATIEDPAGNRTGTGPDSTTIVTFAKTNNGAASLGGLTAVAAVGGIATETVTGGIAGTIKLQASATLSSGAASSNTLTFTIAIGPASQIDLAGQQADLASGTPRTFTATIEDGGGNPITSGPDSSVSVTFAKTNTGSASVDGLATVAATAGVATDVVTGDQVGSVKLGASATLGSGAASSNSRTFNVVPGPSAQIALTGGTGNLKSGVARTVTATVEDANGNPIVIGTDSGASITFAQTSGTGTVTGLTTVAATAGVATDAVTGNLAGPVNLQATATLTAPAGATSSNTLTFPITAGDATQLILAGDTSDLPAGASRTFTATVEDAVGNTVTTGPDSTTKITFAQNGGSPATVTGLGKVNAVAGVVTQTLTGGLAGSVTLLATATLNSGAVGATPLTFNVLLGPASQIILSGDTSDLTSGIQRTFTAIIADAGGNPITTGPDSTVNVTLGKSNPAGSGTVTGLATAAAVSGAVTETVTGNLAGVLKLQATATLSGGAPTSNTLTVNILAGPASQVALTGSQADLASGTARTYTATVEDAAGNAITSGPDSTPDIAFAKTNAGGGSVTGLATVTAVGGVSIDSVTGVLAGTIKVQASATLSGPGATSSNTKTFNVVAGPATQIVLTGGVANLQGGISRIFTATIEDAVGNTVTAGSDSTANVTLAEASGTGTVTGLTSSAANSGLATDSVTGGLIGSVSLQASATLGGNPVSSNTRTFNVTLGAASQIALTGSTADLAAGLTNTVTATIEDAGGNPVGSPGTELEFAL